MLCHYCGHWNDSSEHRCGRCGRRMEGKASGSWARSGLEERESQIVPVPILDQAPTAPAPQPEWKQQLDQKLDDYRMRQASRQGSEQVAAAAGASSDLSSKPNVISFAGISAPDAQAPARNELKKALSMRKVDPKWRPIQRPATPAKLPPLRKSETPRRPQSAPPRAAAATPLSKGLKESPIGTPAAPLTVRAVAGLLDFVLVLVALGMFIGVFQLMGGPIMTDLEGLRALAFAFFAITLFYWVFYIRYIGETAGMTWMGLRLVSFDGRPPTEGQRRARAFGTILSTAAVGMGFAWSVADDEQLSWHDRMSKTFVVQDDQRAAADASRQATRQVRSAQPPSPPLRPLGSTDSSA